MSASGEDSHDLPHDMSNLSDSAQTEAMPSEGAASEKKKYGCSHYERRCAYVSPCCSKVYPCRICHDDSEKHKIDRHAVSEIICLVCDTRQPVNRNCASCGVEFGKYYCPICRLFDDRDKRQFHCDQCGICRVDGRENFFHCPTCDICLCINLQDSHKCVEKVTHANCSVCLEDLHTSRESLSVMSCGHITHSIYACPLCCQTMVDMNSAWQSLDGEVANTPMPDEYKHVRVTILCRDCHKISSVPFHVVGLKCPACGSYNTCRESSAHRVESDEDDLPASASGSHGQTSSSDESSSSGGWNSSDSDTSSYSSSSSMQQNDDHL